MTKKTQELAVLVDEVVVTDEQHAKFLAILAKDKMTGDARALRQAGVAGTTGQLRAYAKEHLAEDAREARGWSLTKVENCTWEVAINPDHPAWDRANARVLKAYHPAYRDKVEVTGTDGKPLETEDRSASLADVARVLEAVGALAELKLAAARHGRSDALPALPAAP